MASLGQDLKKERELRGISLNEIAETTKINLRFLRFLEEDQLEMLPGKFFIKGIIKAYTEYLGMEPEAYLNQYYEIERIKKESEEEARKEVIEEPAVSKKVKWIFIIVLSLILALVIVSGLYLLLQKKPPPPEPAQQPPPSAVKLEAPTPAPEQPEPEQKPAPRPTHIDLRMSFVQETWVQVFADGDLVLDGLKSPGEAFKTRAQAELVIYSGNAGGFAYFLNGKKGKPLGRPGDVIRDIRITLQNMDRFVEESLPENSAPQE